MWPRLFLSVRCALSSTSCPVAAPAALPTDLTRASLPIVHCPPRDYGDKKGGASLKRARDLVSVEQAKELRVWCHGGVAQVREAVRADHERKRAEYKRKLHE